MGRLKLKNCAHLSRCLANLLASGLPLLTAIKLLQEEALLPNPIAQRTLLNLKQGKSLAEIWKQEKMPKLLVSWLEIAEEQGDYVISLEQSALFYHHCAILSEQFQRLVRYPFFVFFMTSIVFLWIWKMIMPQFANLYNTLQISPPSYLDFVFNFMLVFQIMCWIMPLIVYFAYKKMHKRYLFFLLQHTPIMKQITSTFATYFIVHQLMISLKSGLPIMRGLELAASTAPWPQLAYAINRVKERVLQGKELALAFKPEKLFLSTLYHMTILGEAGGCCEQLWEHLTKSTLESLKNQIKSILLWLEPLILCIAGFGVAILVLSWMMPFMTLIEGI